MTTVHEVSEALAAAATARVAAVAPLPSRHRRAYELIAEAVILLVLLASASILVRS